MSLTDQPDFDEALQQYYQILRTRQSQIIGIIRETSELVESLDTRAEETNRDAGTDRKVKLAFSMISALANILDEQMSALDIWERMLSAQQFAPPSKNAARCDFEISVN